MTSQGHPAIGILGLGQIGGSIALDLVGDTQVSFYARSAEVQEFGRAAGFEPCRSLSELSRRSDLIFIAVPVDQTIGVMEDLKEYLRPQQIITDVGSTKASLAEWALKSSWPTDVEFIGGHPMAGTDRSGFAGARKGLFEGRTWILTPDIGERNRSADSLIRLMQFVTSKLGARVGIMDSETHDHSVAMVSHLEHVIATALVSLVRSSNERSMLSHLVAGSFMDATRVAKSSSKMAVPFLCENLFLAKTVSDFMAEIEKISSMLIDQESLSNIWEGNADWRRDLERNVSVSDVVTVKRDSGLIGVLKVMTREGRFICSVDPGSTEILLNLC
ncbi:MAG: prephenate dehydrogenase/arogenate dehydrogenase family protein [Acidimicrobiaceae bacterium]|nr:prephenate dehydrogenase/arogenate dehydrogenase family protein [Acidimicrobiaceae bacterium]